MSLFIKKYFPCITLLHFSHYVPHLTSEPGSIPSGNVPCIARHMRMLHPLLMVNFIHIPQDYCIGTHDDVIKWKHFPRYWPFVRVIHRPPVNSPHKDQWHGALMFSLIYVWINGWENNREVGDLRRCRVHYDVIVMTLVSLKRVLTTLKNMGKETTWIH